MGLACLVCGAEAADPSRSVPCVESCLVTCEGAVAFLSRNFVCSARCAETREWARSFEDDGVARMVGAAVRALAPLPLPPVGEAGRPRDATACVHCGAPGAALSIMGARAVAAPALDAEALPGELACSPACALAHAASSRPSDPGNAFEINYNAHGGRAARLHRAPRRELLERFGGKLSPSRLAALVAAPSGPGAGRALVRDVRVLPVDGARRDGARVLTPPGSPFPLSTTPEPTAPHSRFGSRPAPAAPGGDGSASPRTARLCKRTTARVVATSRDSR